MIEPSGRRFFERVVVALDACSLRSTALEVAARLASASNGELVGLFVEDINLINLSSLPFSREISMRSLQTRSLETIEVERQLRQAAGEARRELARIADRMNIAWRFDVVRGEMNRELVSAARKTDLLVLCEDSEVTDQRQADICVEIVVQDVAFVGSVLVGRQVRSGQGGVVALVEANACGDSVILRAAELAMAQDQPLILFVIAQSDEEAEDLKQQSEHALAGVQPVQMRRFSDFDLSILVHNINAVRPSVVIICSADDNVQSQTRIRRLVSQINAPILFLRRDD